MTHVQETWANNYIATTVQLHIGDKPASTFWMQFIDHLGTDALDICDDNGTSLFHYAVGCLDDSAILKLMEKGASLMNRNWTEVSVDDEDEDYDNLYPEQVPHSGTDREVSEANHFF